MPVQPEEAIPLHTLFCVLLSCYDVMAHKQLQCIRGSKAPTAHLWSLSVLSRLFCENLLIKTLSRSVNSHALLGHLNSIIIIHHHSC